MVRDNPGFYPESTLSHRQGLEVGRGVSDDLRSGILAGLDDLSDSLLGIEGGEVAAQPARGDSEIRDQVLSALRDGYPQGDGNRRRRVPW